MDSGRDNNAIYTRELQNGVSNRELFVFLEILHLQGMCRKYDTHIIPCRVRLSILKSQNTVANIHVNKLLNFCYKYF